jgi:hypothetical protein
MKYLLIVLIFVLGCAQNSSISAPEKEDNTEKTDTLKPKPPMPY